MKYTVVIKSVLLGSAMLLHGDTVPPGERSPDKAVMMRNINIAPMFPAYKNEICRDIAKLYEQGIITENAFMMKLNPEGTPPVDPVSEAAQNFQEMRAELRKYAPLRVGILIQASIGHGYWRDSPPADFTRMETLAPDQPEALTHIVCPYDPKVRSYLRGIAVKLGHLKPDFLLIDDDYRIITGRYGCFCALHIAGFNHLTGNSYTRESLSDAVRNDRRVALEYERFLGETFGEALSEFRAALNEASPGTNIYYCSCTRDLKFSADFARRLAAPGQKPVIRLNNGRYSRETMRDFPLRMYTTAAMIDYLNGGEFELLSEPDTCPHNQYATSAALLNCHMAGSIMEGVAGAKHWITPLAAYEPESGKAYRNILASYRGFYQELAKLQRRKQDLGVTMVLPGRKFQTHSVFHNESIDAKVEFVVSMTRLGVPGNYSKASDTVSVLNVEFIDSWSDAEIRAMLARGAILEGSAALRLAERGFSRELGVDVSPGIAAKTTVEQLSDGRPLRCQSGTLVTLKPRSGQTRVLSTLYSESRNGAKRTLQAISPGMIRYRNVLIFAGSPVRHIYWPDHTAFLNETRKKAVLEQLTQMTEVPVLYAGPDDIAVKLWLVGNQVIMPVITLGRDDMPEMELTVSRMPIRVESLQPKGDWREVAFRRETPSRIVLEEEFRATRPYVLRFSY